MCARPVREPQQSAVLKGATCCYCGLCGKAGSLPVQQPAATEWTQYPVSHMVLRATACPPALLSVALALIHFWLRVLEGGIPIQCKSVSWRWHTVIVSLGCRRQYHAFEAGSRKSPPRVFLLHRSIYARLLSRYFLSLPGKQVRMRPLHSWRRPNIALKRLKPMKLNQIGSPAAWTAPEVTLALCSTATREPISSLICYSGKFLF